MNDLLLIKNRLKNIIFEGVSLEGCLSQSNELSRWEERLIPGDYPDTLCWPDIDYSDRSRAVWAPAAHYSRLLLLIFEHGPEGLRDVNFRDKILKAAAFFVEHDYQSDNWWYNTISVPRNIADLALVLDEYLPPVLRAKMIDMIHRGSLSVMTAKYVLTGANCLWVCSTTLREGVLTENIDLLRQARDKAAGEMCFASEGVQPDGSFFQHGPRLYSGGYGRAYAFDIAQLVYLFDGTSYQFASEQLNVLLTHLLDGLRHMTQGHILDYQCLGRQYTRRNDADVGFLRKALDLLVNAQGLPRRDELAGYRNTVFEGTPFTGTRYFPYAAFLAHHTGSLYVGAKFLWGQMYDQEVCNSEGILGYNLSYGTHHCAMITGTEYFNITPVWRYDHIPGTTARKETDEQLLAHPAWHFRQISEGGGAQKGDIAVIWENAIHETVSALTADFAFPGGFVSLNASVHDNEHQPLHTTLDQCFSENDPIIDNGAVVHHGIRYRSLDGSILTPDVRNVTGNWRRNNQSLSDAPVSAALFTLTVEYPAGEGSCAYLLSPADAPEPSVTLLRNDNAVQAILLPDGRVMAVFHEDTVLTVPDGRLIRHGKGEYLE